mmetsp:Transcript_27546/g.39440  ORF Transcript_27546/g.39440 Transcript_27546/m.39440 type:complete len:271 (+) Transcript_27546:136-948(+)|eukprot:CAMPEP_0172424610 /NCGR_PEP_ID=MMETSP1064-20121228/26657_1 /TAXON_ID=202472 /ORGANISM="Aulacoseira subarctica , Strain CCAP 1002/5" /LENGTH=270 /DNA_ID=CAMNT_0013166859 /DNA_START=58 /DNA_END=873 /DNA_ORIENTATION=+
MARGRKRSTSSATNLEHDNKNKKRATKEEKANEAVETAAMWGNSNGGTSSRSSRKASSSSSSRVNNQLAASSKLFDAYCDHENDPTVINMEGIEKLCEHVGIDPMKDTRILVLLWKLNASEKPGHVTKEEWIKGCEKLGIDSIDKIKRMLPSLETGFIDEDDFKEFYKFVFQFNREGTHRTLDKGLVTALQELVLKDRIDEKRLATWVDFLESQQNENYSRITLDQWISFFDFCLECEDLETDYDEVNSAWPVLIDEYVEYMKTNNNKKK